MCNMTRRTPHLHVNIAVLVTVWVLALATCAVAVTVTEPLVAPRQVAVPLSLGSLLIETWIASETDHVWPEQLTQATLAHPLGATAVAKN